MSKFIAKSNITSSKDKGAQEDVNDAISKVLKAVFVSDEAEIARFQHENTIDMIKHDIAVRKVNLNKIQLENLRSLVDINLANAKTHQEQSRADLITKVFNAIDIIKLPTTWQYYIIQSILYPSSTKTPIDFEIEGQLKEYVKLEQQASAEKHVHEAKIVKLDAEMKEMDVERNRQAMEKSNRQRTEKLKE